MVENGIYGLQQQATRPPPTITLSQDVGQLIDWHCKLELSQHPSLQGMFAVAARNSSSVAQTTYLLPPISSILKPNGDRMIRLMHEPPACLNIVYKTGT
jgi:hypothetical protein